MSKVLAVLIVVLSLSPTVAGQSTGQIEFNGNYYSTIESVRETYNSMLSRSSNVLGCGPKTSKADVLRGYYDNSTNWICHLGHEANNEQYQRNKAMILTHSSGRVWGSAQTGSSGLATRNYQCPDHNRGTPYRHAFYITPMDDVCNSNLREYVSSSVRINSYWQNGHGSTYFFYRWFPGQFYWLDGSIAVTPAAIRGHAMRSYAWCNWYNERCH